MQEAEDELVAGMQGLGIQKLRGLPTPAGKHIRFGEDGKQEPDQGQAAPAAAEGALKLRGLPTPQGKHIKFDD